MHSFSIHKYGDLSNGCGSTGGIYNREKLQDVQATYKGNASYAISSPRVQLSGSKSVIGRAMVLYADNDTLYDPVACCVIGFENKDWSDQNFRISHKKSISTA